MNQYNVTCFNGWTEKTKVRTVEAENVLYARTSHKAVSNRMMANGWSVIRVEDMQGNILYQGQHKKCY